MKSWVSRQILVYGGTLFLLCTCALAQEPTIPKNDEKARMLFDQGYEMLQSGQYEGAAKAFSESYRLSGRALILFHLADAYERQNQLQDALDTLILYEPHAEPGESSMIRKRIKALEERITKSEVPVKEPDPPLIEPKSSPLPYVLLGGGAAVLVVGGVLSIFILKTRNDIEGHCGTSDSGYYCESSSEELFRRDKNLSLVSDISFGVGGALVLTSLILFLIDDKPDDKQTGLLLTPEPSGFSLQFSTSF